MNLIGPTLENPMWKIAYPLFGPCKNKAQVTLGFNAMRNGNNGEEIDCCYLWFILIFPLKVESCTVASPEFEVPNRACFP